MRALARDIPIRDYASNLGWQHIYNSKMIRFTIKNAHRQIFSFSTNHVLRVVTALDGYAKALESIANKYEIETLGSRTGIGQVKTAGKTK